MIGGSGHIGSFLLPRLVRAGHEVVNVSRGSSAPYGEAPERREVQQVVADRHREDREGVFADRIAGLDGDAVVDLVCFTLESAQQLVDGLRGRTGQLVGCGSIWAAGPSRTLPITEERRTPPVGEYGVQKDRIAAMLRAETAAGGLSTVTLHPGHISGPGWAPIGPTGNLDPEVWRALSAGDPLPIPSIGAETMHHVHADDVAQAFQLALERRDAVAGEEFFVTAADAFAVRGYAAAAAAWFGQRAELRPVGWDAFRAGLTEEHAETSWQHLSRSQVVSIRKAQRLLGYDPQHTVEATTLEAVRWLVDHDRLEVARPLVAAAGGTSSNG